MDGSIRHLSTERARGGWCGLGTWWMFGAAALIAVAQVMAATAAPAWGVTDAEAIGHLNAQRAANGIPGQVAVDPALSDGCAKHNNWMSLNGVSHVEPAGSPGYTLEGAEAGSQSVLAGGQPPWSSPDENPWERAPYHLAQLLEPTLAVTGYNESLGFACANTLNGYKTKRRAIPASDQVFVYPGPGARIYRKMVASESPGTPGEEVGIPQGRVTGPYLHVFVAGPSVEKAIGPFLLSAALVRVGAGRGAKKATSARKRYPRKPRVLITSHRTGGFVIPREPLKPRGKYRVRVGVRFGTQAPQFTYSWRFRTRGKG